LISLFIFYVFEKIAKDKMYLTNKKLNVAATTL